MKLLIKAFLSRISHSYSQHNNTPHKSTYLLFKRMLIQVTTTQAPFHLLNTSVPKLFKNQKERCLFELYLNPMHSIVEVSRKSGTMVTKVSQTLLSHQTNNLTNSTPLNHITSYAMHDSKYIVKNILATSAGTNNNDSTVESHRNSSIL
jgi:hypothetical protein